VGTRWGRTVVAGLIGFGGFALMAAPPPAHAAPTLRFAAAPVQGDVCVAPCAVHFDAIGDGHGSATDDPSYARPFHSLLFAWDFKDANAGAATWPISGRSKNTAIGAIAGHVYEKPGRYAVGLRVTNPDGESASVVAIGLVQVADPDAVFGADRTWCFANSGTPGGAGFEACPVQSASRHVVIGYEANGFETALQTCGAVAMKTRCLFRAGDYFGANSMVPLANGPGPGLISRFGTGPNPVVYGGDGFLILRSGWTVAHLEVWLNGGESGPLFLISAPNGNATVFDVKAPVLRGACFESASNDTPVHSDLVAVVGLECHARPTSSTAGIYLRAERALLMGNWIDNGYEGQFNVRTVHFPRSVIQHSLLERPSSRRNAIQLRAWAGSTAGGSPIGPPPSPTAFVIVSDNVMRADDAETVVRTCQSNDCVDTARAPGIENVILERNFVSISTGSGLPPGQMPRAFWLQGGDMTVRNNILDLQGLLATQTQARNRLVDHSANLASAPSLNDDEIQVLNNTVYYDDASPNGFQICGGGTHGGGHLCRNNLIYLPNETGPRQESDDAAAWTAADNLFPKTLPFAAPVPGQGLTAPTHFRIATSSVAFDTGWDPRGVAIEDWLDFSGRCRPETGTDPRTGGAWDVGALEANAGLHCLATPEPGTALLLGAGLAALARRPRGAGARRTAVRPVT